MNLAEALEASVVPKPSGQLCKLGRHIETMTKTGEIDVFVGLLQTCSADSLSSILAKTPYSVSQTLIKLHKAGRCGCFK